MAQLFAKNKLYGEASKLKSSTLKDKIEIIKKWHDDYHNGTLKTDNEIQIEQDYNHDIFHEVLGYSSRKPKTFEAKPSTPTGQIPDAKLGYFDLENNVDNISAVVELKAASVDLDRPQQRADNLSPVQQGFKYKPQFRDCPFVIISNFFEFRLYNDNMLDYEVWTLDELVEPADDYIVFKTFYYLLNSSNFTTRVGKSKAQDFLADVRVEQEEIGKKFYKEYREVRVTLIENIIKNNKLFATDLDQVIQKAQTIIDRVIFVCFAEDMGIFPDNILSKQLNSNHKKPIWSILKNVFVEIEQGGDDLETKNGYDSSLFRADSVIEKLKIDDSALRGLVEISRYNFKEDLSVTVLGHIFEQSISDLEEIRTSVLGSKGIEYVAEKQRKKAGIYYTPNYIIRYIVDNTLGTYLRGKEEKLKNEHNLHSGIIGSNYAKREEKAYSEYFEFIKTVKVVDPACGSGSFLVYVFEYLLMEYKRVGRILGLDKGIADFDSVYKEYILHNNIYGVDLNVESVEITKLSLWLKTAQKDKKLMTLDDNIKCGNSLISDPVVAGKKAFDWKTKFSDIYKNGGFDVVVGNPPYGAKLNKQEQSYLIRRYIRGGSETAISFLKQGYDSLKENGRIGYIIPKSLSYASNYSSIRDYLLSSLDLLVDCKKVWKEVKLEQVIAIFEKSSKTKTYQTLKRDSEMILNVGVVSKQSVKKFGFYLNDINEDELNLAKKILSNSLFLNGISKNTRGVPIQEAIKESGSTKVLGGANIGRNGVHSIKGYISKDFFVDENGKILPNSVLCQNIVAHIEYPRDHLKIVATIPDSTEYVIVDSINQISSDVVDRKVLWALLNSTLINWFVYRFIFGKAIRTMHFDNPVTSRIPVSKDTEAKQGYLIKLFESRNKAVSELDIYENRFKQLLESKYVIGGSANLIKWWRYGYKHLVKQLETRLSIEQADELLGIYEKYRKPCLELENNIDKIDYEINQFVYKLYKLTSTEIKIVENS